MAYCNEEGCDVLVSGKCINSLQLDTCPHYILSEPEIEEEVSEEDELDNDEIEISETINLVGVHSGKLLTINEVNSVSTSGTTRLIILAGMPDAGKTTLILSLMNLFQNSSSYQGFIFSGSKTLLSFEEKNHNSTINSERETPETDRTTFGNSSFFHLKITKLDDKRSANLLFTDISGETFRLITESNEEAKKFSLAKRADHFVLFFDSNKLSSYQDRHAARTRGIDILKSLIESKSLLPPTKIQIVFSRWDMLLKKGDVEEHRKFIVRIKEEILSNFASNFEIEFYEISARPAEGSDLTLGHGIDLVLPVWFDPPIVEINDTEMMKGIICEREFFKYQNYYDLL